MKGHIGNLNENSDSCGKRTCLHETSGHCSAGREKVCVLLERLATYFRPERYHLPKTASQQISITRGLELVCPIRLGLCAYC